MELAAEERKAELWELSQVQRSSFHADKDHYKAFLAALETDDG